MNINRAFLLMSVFHSSCKNPKHKKGQLRVTTFSPQALQATNGNVEAAIELLFNDME